MIRFDTNFSRGVLIRLGLVLALAAVVVALNVGFLSQVYFRDQLTATGYLVNGGILALFLLGLGRVVFALMRYMREERALGRFAEAMEHERYGVEIPSNSLIGERYHAILALSRQNAPINHAALASALVARESTSISLPKFINNILILTGVFGTIVSLSIALIGASNVLDTTGQELGNMGMVIHGMSTALSTTITAIVCYMIYGYFYIKLTDAQTHVLSGVEQVTTLYLLPRYAPTGENIMQRVTGLLRKLEEVAGSMRSAQTDYVEAGTQLHKLMVAMNQRVKPMSDDLRQIKLLLREGFRLPAPAVEPAEVE